MGSRRNRTAEEPAALVRSRDLEAEGISRTRIQALVRTGELERVARGLYRRDGSAFSEFETLAAVGKRVPGAVICLLTALNVHEIGTQLPREVWIAIDRKARRPHVPELPLRIVCFSGSMLRIGVETRTVQGVQMRVTSVARTVVDCFRYRNKIGVDVAVEALRDALHSRKTTIAELARMAELCRAATVMRPYLEAMVA